MLSGRNGLKGNASSGWRRKLLCDGHRSYMMGVLEEVEKQCNWRQICVNTIEIGALRMTDG
jgi:hypothetical protein